MRICLFMENVGILGVLTFNLVTDVKMGGAKIVFRLIEKTPNDTS